MNPSAPHRIQALRQLLDSRAKGANPSQASLSDQIRDLIDIAETLGLYDAADWVRELDNQS